ncbi:glycosyltransferase family 4 protein [Clostridium aminobutyricum]|uniref:Glycosyltransferase family 4 protein n=1 Tax=Clostridium aminobutyricum TaxID=33953 RepID=A0A939DAK0_CLOAM|nr:glycosyltransferase family 4 protein [Clostridium aminobutyricum]MBN7774067.1 glycosyltransferase family 4 protein [Clostridium aminobutyricum]
MNILFLMIISPQIEANPNLYTELMEEFRDEGHEVYVAAIDEKKNGRQTRISMEKGIRILHIRTGNLFNVNPIEKGLTTLSLGGLFRKGLREYYSQVKFDLVMMPTPPITFAPAMDYIKKRDGAKAYLILRDIFPQNAKDLNLMNNELLFQFFRTKEKAMYKVSDFIGCMSQGNIDYVLRHNPEVDKSKLELLPNWSKFSPEEDKTDLKIDYKAKYGIEGKFVCIFGGNIGWPQELEFLLELVMAVKERKEIVFLIVGKGIMKPKIEKIIQTENLTNVYLRDYLPKEDYDGLVAQCDVGLINLDRRFTIPNIPSKTTGYFKAGIPILASIDANTDYGKILDEAKAGLWSVTGDLETYKKNLLYFMEHPEETKQMGRNGKNYLKEYLSVTKAYNTIMRHFNG